MASKGGARSSTNLLRLSGIIFFIVGWFHVARYFLKIEMRIAGFELTILGSLILGVMLLFLSGACFWNARK